MATTYEWTISALDVEKKKDTLEDIVTTVHWRLQAKDDLDDLTAETYGANSLTAPDSNNFTAFSDLTKEQIVQWLEASFVTVTETINPDDPDGELLVSTDNRLQSIKGSLAAKILDKREPKTETLKPPWE